MGGRVHRLKTWDFYFDSVVRGLKTFEIRRNDRDFRVGDVLELMETVPDGLSPKQTGRSHRVQVCYMTDFGQRDNFVVLGIKPIQDAKETINA